MPFRAPNPTSGSSYQASWLKRILEAARASRLLPGRGYRVKYTSGGTILEIEPGARARAGVTIMQVVSYHQDADDGDYLVCRPPDGDEGGADDVNVAVEPQLQSAITTQTMPDATAWSYSAYVEATQQRTATQTAGGSAVLTEYISPPFISTDFVPVFQCSNAGVTVISVALSLVALTGRQWASPASE